MTKIVISYRRQVSEAITGRIRDCLVDAYGHESVFIDIDSIPIGVDFRDYIADALQHTDIMLVIIGPHWVGEQARKMRLQNPTDPVRIELEKAFELGIQVWPVLVEDAVMPDPSKLPEPLKHFSNRNAAIINAGRDFHPHMNRLIHEIDDRLGLPAKNRNSGLAPPRLRKVGPHEESATDVVSLQSRPTRSPANSIMALAAAAGAAFIIAAAWFVLGHPQKSAPNQLIQTATTPTASSTLTAGSSGAVDCSQEKVLHSLGSTASTTITFVNKMSQPRLVYWLDFHGNRVLYATLQGGQSASQLTYISHPWVVTDGSNNCIAIYMPTPNAQTIAVVK